MKKLSLPVIIICCAAAVVSAQLKQRVAVLPSVGDLEPQGLILLTDKVREIATKNLPIENFTILKQDVITKLIGAEELYKACKEGVCIGDLAKKTDANYGARCDVIKFDNRLVLKFEIYSVIEEAIFETFIDDDVKDFRGMFASLEKRLPSAFQKMVSVQNKALADAKDKAIEQQKQEAEAKARQEAKAQEEYIPTPASVVQDTTPASVIQETTPDTVVQETAPIKPVYKTKNGAYDDSDDKPRILQNRISIEFAMGGMFGSYKYSYGDTVRHNRSVGGLSAYLSLDFKYIELLENMAANGGGLVLGFLVKYPFVFDQVPVRASPIFGFGGIRVYDMDHNNNEYLSTGLILGGRIDVGISKITYLRSEYLYNLGVGKIREGYYKGSSGMSLKTGGGLDIGLGEKKKAFWRTELMYNWLSAYNPKYEHRVDVKGTIHYVDIKTGIGYKWGGGKKKVRVKIQEIEVE